MDHNDILFRFVCPSCDALNAPTVEKSDYETEGTVSASCKACGSDYLIGWRMKIDAEMIDEEIDVEAMIWDDDHEDDDIEDDE